MREMRDSGIEWIGKIPVDWATTRIGNLFRFSSGDSLTNEEMQDEGLYKVYGANGPRGYYHHTNLAGKHILIGRVGALCGNIHVVDEPVWVTEHALIAKQISPDVCTDFAGRVFESMNLGQYSKASAQPVIASSVVQRLQIPIPPSLEQRRIADYLDRKCSQIDAIIARQQEVIEKLKAYKLSVITETVTKGLNPDVPMKDSGVEWIGEIPEHWKIGKLSFFTVQIGDGLHGTPEFDDKGEYYFINGNNLGDTYITIRESTKSVSSDEYNKYFIALNENTLLISLNGTIGNVSQYHGEQIILGKSAGYIIVDSRRELTVDYLKFYLQSKSVKTLFELSFAGTTISNLSLETLRNLPVCIMTSEEQFHIAKLLDKKSTKIDQVIQKKQLTIDKLSEYRKSLIYEVVTGKKEV